MYGFLGIFAEKETRISTKIRKNPIAFMLQL